MVVVPNRRRIMRIRNRPPPTPTPTLSWSSSIQNRVPLDGSTITEPNEARQAVGLRSFARGAGPCASVPSLRAIVREQQIALAALLEQLKIEKLGREGAELKGK